MRQNRRKEVLRDGRAGPEAEFAPGLVGAEAHLVFEAAVVVESRPAASSIVRPASVSSRRLPRRVKSCTL